MIMAALLKIQLSGHHMNGCSVDVGRWRDDFAFLE